MTPVRIKSIQAFGTRSLRITEAPILSSTVNHSRGEWTLTEGRYLVHLDTDRLDVTLATSLMLSGATVSPVTRDKTGKVVLVLVVHSPIIVPEDYVAAYDNKRSEDGERRRPGRPKKVRIEE